MNALVTGLASVGAAARRASAPMRGLTFQMVAMTWAAKMTLDEFDARGRARRRRRPTGVWWQGTIWTIIGAIMWAWIVCAVVWGLTR